MKFHKEFEGFNINWIEIFDSCSISQRYLVKLLADFGINVSYSSFNRWSLLNSFPDIVLGFLLGYFRREILDILK